MGAKAYILNLSENVRRSLEYKRRNGEWGGKAPLGYMNVRDANNRSILVHDPERAFLVRMLFEDYAKGCFSISGDLVRTAREWGLKNKTRKGGYLSASQIQHILRNPFYYGAMRIKDRLCPHNYPPLISQGLFDRCTEVQLGKTRATATRYSEKPFVFRGLIKCATSGRTVTSDLKKGKHLYLICRDPLEHTNKLFVPETTVLDQINAALSSIRISDHLLDALLTHMKTSHAAEKRFYADAITSLRRDYDLINERLATLLDLRLDKSITQSEYDKKALSLKYKQAEIAARIEQHQLGNSNFRTTLETLITLASRAVELFERSKTEQKRQLIALVFSNLRLRGKKLEYSLRSPFDLMVNRPTHTSWLGD